MLKQALSGQLFDFDSVVFCLGYCLSPRFVSVQGVPIPFVLWETIISPEPNRTQWRVYEDKGQLTPQVQIYMPSWTVSIITRWCQESLIVLE